MRRTIAKRLAESTGPIPHFYPHRRLRRHEPALAAPAAHEIEGTKISVNDFIVRAAALALRHHPNVNASWGDDAITQHGEIHVGIAVSTPEGLITPVVRNADQKSVLEIAEEVRALAEKAKNRKLMPNEYQGSTFTISNLGAWGIEEFTAIINPPNVGDPRDRRGRGAGGRRRPADRRPRPDEGHDVVRSPRRRRRRAARSF